MKKFNVTLVVLLLVFMGWGQEDDQNGANNPSKTGSAYTVYGEAVAPEDAVSTMELSKTYAKMSVNDSVQSKFRATVTDVCKAKGCWMKLQLEDGKEAMVRFKDYGFFMPMDIEGREVVVNGQAFVTEMSVDDQRHYAKDGGQSDAEIAKITTPKKTYGFEADGVLLANQD
ncbi:MAG: DUF4920 domain-containing protein [Pricia sp.]